MPTMALYWFRQCLHLKHVVIPHVIHIVSLFGISEKESGMLESQSHSAAMLDF